MALQRLALIGARGHYNMPLRALPEMPGVRVVGVSAGGIDDPPTPLLDWCKQNGHEPQVFDDYRRMFDAVRPDAVSVCGPFELHARMSIDAIGRGIHVFAEKPIALNLDDLEQLRLAHRANPKVHIAGMMASRFDPGFFTAWKLVGQGAIGDVRLINARKSYRLGRRPAYYLDRKTYGGTIPWVGSHAIDWMLWMISPHKIESIYALHSSQANENHGTMERSATCCFGFEGGRMATVSIDVFRPDKAPSHGDDWIRIVGSAGVIEARPNSVVLINSSHDGSEPMAATSGGQIFKDFVDHIDGRRTGLIDAQQTIVLTEVCLLARQSADEGGKPVILSADKRLGFAR